MRSASGVREHPALLRSLGLRVDRDATNQGLHSQDASLQRFHRSAASVPQRVRQDAGLVVAER